MTSFAYQSDLRFLKAHDPHAPFGVAGIAWDGATTNRPGARMAPRAIREASHMLCDGTHPLFDTSPIGALADCGDLPLPNTSIERMREALGTLVPPLLTRHHMAWLGGDHSITLPLLRAYRAQFGRPLAVIHFDAHCDTWTDHFGEPGGHGTWVHDACTEGLTEPSGMVQIGLRSPAERAARHYVSDRGGLVFDARALRGLESPRQLAEVIEAVAQRLTSLGAPVYLTLDIDCLDPAFAPGTGTPEPGGLSTNQVLSLLEAWAPRLPFVGMDCVEVSPPYDQAERSSQAAAVFVWTYLCARLACRDAARWPGA